MILPFNYDTSQNHNNQQDEWNKNEKEAGTGIAELMKMHLKMESSRSLREKFKFSRYFFLKFHLLFKILFYFDSS